jgi:hypothetical protein
MLAISGRPASRALLQLLGRGIASSRWPAKGEIQLGYTCWFTWIAKSECPAAELRTLQTGQVG